MMLFSEKDYSYHAETVRQGPLFLGLVVAEGHPKRPWAVECNPFGVGADAFLPELS
jgi:hypothetical protein